MQDKGVGKTMWLGEIPACDVYKWGERQTIEECSRLIYKMAERVL